MGSQTLDRLCICLPSVGLRFFALFYIYSCLTCEPSLCVVGESSGTSARCLVVVYLMDIDAVTYSSTVVDITRLLTLLPALGPSAHGLSNHLSYSHAIKM